MQGYDIASTCSLPFWSSNGATGGTLSTFGATLTVTDTRASLPIGARKIAADADALARMDIPPGTLTNIIWRTGWNFYRARSAHSVYRARLTGELDPECRKVFDYAASAGRIVKPAEVVEGASVSRSVASFALNELLALGRVERVGHGKYVALVGTAV